MAPWRFLLIVALAFGSLLPHCAGAAPVAAATAHHAGMARDEQQPVKAHVSDACIGCATPVRLAFAVTAEPITATNPHVLLATAPTTRVTALDPPPPRSEA